MRYSFVFYETIAIVFCEVFDRLVDYKFTLISAAADLVILQLLQCLLYSSLLLDYCYSVVESQSPQIVTDTAKLVVCRITDTYALFALAHLVVLQLPEYPL